MADYYYGKTGKDNLYGLLADKRIVLWSKATNKFSAFDNIAEAAKHFGNPFEDRALYWENGEWKRVHIFLEGYQGKVFEGFTPD
jgi:hypothetical protein